MKRLLFLLAILLAGCTSRDDTMRALEALGYTQIEVTGYRWFGCADSEDFHTGFRAVGMNGKPVSGVVCGAFLKGSTVRFD